jgi:phosphoribosylanthranilate isomerase
MTVRRTTTPRIKICGITTVKDALAAAGLGVDAIGLNFYSGSSRCVGIAAATQIVKAVPPAVEPVALFVNEPFDRIERTLYALVGVRTVQWHGAAPELPPGDDTRFIPAFAVRDRADLDRIDAYLARCRQQQRMPAAVLIDGHAAGEYGGTGQPAPWRLLADYRPGVPLYLAGGLTPDNVAEAIRLVRPDVVDVASGVESSPGRKDADLMRRFVDAVRSG